MSVVVVRALYTCTRTDGVRYTLVNVINAAFFFYVGINTPRVRVIVVAVLKIILQPPDLYDSVGHSTRGNVFFFHFVFFSEGIASQINRKQGGNVALLLETG